jgi:UDP-glucuronate decarboxylase
MEGLEFGDLVTPRTAFTGLTCADRVVITGATGWMGRELIARLIDTRPDLPTLAIASTPRAFSVGRKRLEALAWDHDAIAEWGPTLLVHLAFRTREHLTGGQYEAYIAANINLSASAARLYTLPSLRGAVIASSGAAVSMTGEPYGALKQQDEATFTQLGLQSGIPTVIARIWSVSGSHCPKPHLFALYDLIRQAESTDPVIRIRASHEVRRKYVDAGEFLEVALSGAGLGRSGTIDSAGALVELTELAQQIQIATDTRKPIERPDICPDPDNYFTESREMDNWATETSVALSPLAIQIGRSALAVRRFERT